MEMREIIHALDTAVTEDDVKAALVQATACLGYDHYTLGTRLVNLGGGPYQLVMSSAPQKFLDWYDQEEMLAHDPIVQRGFTTVIPFYSDDIPMSVLRRSEKALTFILTAITHGTAFALTCSQHGYDGRATLINFGRAAWPDVFNREEQKQRASWIAAHAHEAVMRVVIAEAEKRRGGMGALTPNEITTLQMLARGFSAEQVAEKLGVAVRSIQYYAERAMLKLGATCKDQAISKAIETRTISVSSTTIPRSWSTSDKRGDAGRSGPDCMVANPSTQTLIKEIRGARSLDALTDAARIVAKVLGFDTVAYVFMRPGRFDTHQFVITNYGTELLALAEDSRHLARNPLFGGGRFRGLPFFWDEDDTFGVEERDARDGAISEAIAVGGPAHGITAMTMAQDRCTGVLSLGRHAPIAADRHQLRWAAFVLGRAMYERACALAEAHLPNLSDAEMDLLQQLAQNKTVVEAAEALKWKESTARKHCARLVKKLGARNARNAVSVATERRLISTTFSKATIRESDKVVRIA